VERISRLVASSLDPQDILAEILASLPRLFNSEGCSVRIVDGSDLVPLAVHGEIVHTFSDRVPIGTSLAGSIVRDKRLLAVDDLHYHPATGRHARSTGVKVRGWLAAPMIDAQGDVFGILSIHSDFPRRWTERDRVLLQTLAESTTVAIQNAWRFQRTRDVLLASVESLANAVDVKDPTTLNHSRNVSSYARSIADAMQLPDHEIENVALAGLLHDIGKIGIPDRILQKPDILDRDEWELMKTHPVIGEQILGGNAHLAPILSFVRHHHERWDGMGYPDRLSADAIPLGASIVALADAVDTMVSDRPYRKAVPWQLACHIIRSETGKQFAPTVAETFLHLAECGRVERLTATSDIQRTVPLDAEMFSHSLDARALMIFHGIAREIKALTDIDTFVNNGTLIVRDVMELSDIQIFLVDEVAGEIVYRPSRDDLARGFREVRRRIGTGVVGWVVQHGEPLLVPDVLLDDRFIFASVSEVRSELAVPLIADGRVIGAINAESGLPSAFSESDVRLLTATAAHLAQSVEVARLHDQFKRYAATDSLTGLANHRAFYERLEEKIRHTEFTNSVLTVAIMDVDNLKVVNDTYGHLAGDKMLRAIADVMRERCRRSDHVARYGGDEFAFIFADTDLQGATRAADQIVDGLSTCKINVQGKILTLPTGAWGMATYPQDGVRPAELVRVADQRMYTRKRIAKDDRARLAVANQGSPQVERLTRRI
jgi:diguanylate cyclase (GGDEF)-like protein